MQAKYMYDFENCSTVSASWIDLGLMYLCSIHSSVRKYLVKQILFTIYQRVVQIQIKTARNDNHPNPKHHEIQQVQANNQIEAVS